MLRNTFGEEHGKTADEGISRARTVNTLHRKRGHVFAALTAREKGTLRAERDNDSANAFRQKFAGALFRVLDAVHGDSSDGLSLAFVGHEVVEVCQGLQVHWLCRRRIHNTTNDMPSRERDGVVNRFERNLKLQDDTISGFQHFRGGIHIRWLQRVIRSLDHQDAVLSTGIDKDRRDTARQSVNLLDVRGIDAKLFEVLNRGWAEQVAPHARYHEHFRSA